MKLSEIAKLYLPWNRTIIQMSPVRSGSTLVYNLLKNSISGHRVLKQHSYHWCFNHLKVVATVRHPVESVASILRSHGWDTSSKSIEQGVDVFKSHGADAVLALRDNPMVLILSYEKFVDDFDIIFDAFESFFNTQISVTKRTKLKQTFGVESVKAMTNAQGAFESWDKETLIHQNHISEFNGRSGYARTIFTPEQEAHISKRCMEYITAFGYHGRQIT